MEPRCSDIMKCLAARMVDIWIIMFLTNHLEVETNKGKTQWNNR
jgi:hypothetical protein